MQTIRTTVNTTKHTLEPQEVVAALEAHARAGGLGPLDDPYDQVSAVLLPNGGAEVTIVNTPPAQSSGT